MPPHSPRAPVEWHRLRLRAEEGERGREKRERKTESPSHRCQGHTDSPCVTGMLILWIQLAFFMAVWEVEAIIGHGIGADDSVTGTRSVCVLVCDHPLPPATPSYNRWHHICLWVSCHGYSLVAQRRSARGRRGWPLPSVLLPFTSNITHQPLSLPTGVTDYYISHL